jgi:AraC-like DNA-binding protein
VEVNYQEIAPRKELQAYIRCFWVLEAPFYANMAPERIVPDGRMELIFHYGSHFERLKSDGCAVQPRGIITGQIRNALLIRPTGPTGMIAARFYPFGFSSLFPLPSEELAENLYSCEEVLGKAGKNLEERILNAGSTEAQVSILENYFLSLLAKRGHYDFRIPGITRRIYELKGVFKSEDLANEFNIGSRQMERLFKSRVGVSPNFFGRIVRFQQAISLKLSTSTLSLTELGHATGYYDQSHFIKDFKEFSGLSPRHYFAEVHRMADLFSDNL